jgi:carbon starvation protein
MTTIDTATRLQRYIIGEIGGRFRIGALKNRYLAGIAAVGTAYCLVISKGAGTGGMTLWPLFGTTNQVLAGLALLVVTLYIKKCGKRGIYTFAAMLFVLAMTLWAMFRNIVRFHAAGNWLLAAVGSIVFVLALWLCLEAWLSIRPKIS